MPSKPDLKELKSRVAPRLRAIAGVTGVGTPGGVLTVYLERDSAAIRGAVRDVLDAEGAPADVGYVVTGAFKAQ